MYVHIGNGVSINEKDIIAVFNLEEMKNTKAYQKFHEKLLQENSIVNISNENEKSLILTQKNNKIKAYISNIHSNTIRKRKL